LFRVLLSILFFLGSVYAFWQTTDAPVPQQKITVKNVAELHTEEEARKSFDYLNDLRFKAGMSKFLYNENLKNAALSHANYLTSNNRIGHIQSEGEPGFTGVFPKDRVVQAGYKTGMSIENVSNQTIGYKDSVEGLFSAIYHRFGFLDFQVDEIGIGVSQNAQKLSQTAYVYDMGIYEINDLCKGLSYTGEGAYTYAICADKNFRIKKKAFDEGYNACYIRNKKVVIYPYDGQVEVPPAFFDELPDPLPNHRVSGFPISIQFNPHYFKFVKLEKFALFLEGSGTKEEAIIYDHISDINSRFKRNEFALFPLKRLEWGSRYRVEVVYKVFEERFTKRWTFETKKLAVEAIMIDKDKMQVVLEKGKEKILYFKPKDAHDILGDIQYSEKLDVTFIDKNTIKIVTNAEAGEKFRLHVSGREITLLVKP